MRNPETSQYQIHNTHYSLPQDQSAGEHDQGRFVLFLVLVLVLVFILVIMMLMVMMLMVMMLRVMLRGRVRPLAWAIVEEVPAYHSAYESRESEGGGVVHSFYIHSFIHC